MDNRGYTCPELLTSPEALEKDLANPGLCLIDTRPAEQFARGLIPGAFHFDLFGISLVDTSPAPLKAYMSMMRHLFELRGINLEKEIVFYEETPGMRAARGLWFLEYFGHRNVHVLDGGFRAWRQAGYPISTEPTPPTSIQFGYPKIRNYIGSWKEWGDRLDPPIDKPWEKK